MKIKENSSNSESDASLESLETLTESSESFSDTKLLYEKQKDSNKPN